MTKLLGTACVLLLSSNIAHAAPQGTFELPPQHPIIKRKLEPLVPELLGMAQGNTKSEFQKAVQICFNPRKYMDYIFCGQVRMMAINVLYDKYKDQMPIDAGTRHSIEHDSMSEFYRTDKKLSAILTHHPNLYVQYVSNWDAIQTVFLLNQGRDIKSVIEQFSTYYGLMYTNQPLDKYKQIAFTHLENECKRYVQHMTVKPVEGTGQPLESDCVVLGFDKTAGKSSVQAYKKLKETAAAQRMASGQQTESRLPVSDDEARIKDDHHACVVLKAIAACHNLGEFLDSKEDPVRAEKYFKLGCERDNDYRSCLYLSRYYYMERHVQQQKQLCGYNAYGQKLDHTCRYAYDGFKTVTTTWNGDRKPDKEIATHYLNKYLSISKGLCQKGSDTACSDYRRIMEKVEAGTQWHR